MIFDNGILRAEIVPQWHESTRFDRLFAVTSLVDLERGVEWMAHESLIPNVGSGGVGICGEFGISEPVGYDDASPGEPFLKPCVGWLARDGRPYRFMHPYPILDRGGATYEWGENRVTGVWEAPALRGYGCRVARSISLSGDALTFVYEMRNTGEKPISTTEYAHNFALCGGRALSEAYRLTTGSKADDPNSPWIRYGTYPSYARVDSPDSLEIRGWRMVLAPEGYAMEERDDFRAVRFAVWAQAHVFSPEIFKGIELMPGESDRWTRAYRFGDVASLDRGSAG